MIPGRHFDSSPNELVSVNRASWPGSLGWRDRDVPTTRTRLPSITRPPHPGVAEPHSPLVTVASDIPCVRIWDAGVSIRRPGLPM